MLQAFTWQQFLVAALILSVVWLGIVLLVFYRKELFNLLSGGKGDLGAAEPLKHAWQDDFEVSNEDDLMGKPALPDGVSVVSQDDFSFAPRTDLVDGLASSDEVPAEGLLQSDVFDLMENLKPLLEDGTLSKDDFISGVNDEVAEFPRLLKSPLLVSLYEQLVEEVNTGGVLDFKISLTELQADL